MGRTGGATNAERKPFGSVNKKLDVAATSDVGSCVEGSDCGNVEFTKEEIDALVNERLKMKKFDHKVLLGYFCFLVNLVWLRDCLLVWFCF